jgi:hypothetical protein
MPTWLVIAATAAVTIALSGLTRLLGGREKKVSH